MSIERRLATLEDNHARDALLQAIEQRLAFIEANTSVLQGLDLRSEVSKGIMGEEASEAESRAPPAAQVGESSAAPLVEQSAGEASLAAPSAAAPTAPVTPSSSAAVVRTSTLATLEPAHSWLSASSSGCSGSLQDDSARQGSFPSSNARLSSAINERASVRPESLTSPTGSVAAYDKAQVDELGRQLEKVLGFQDALRSLCTEQFATLAVVQAEDATKAKEEMRSLRHQLERLEQHLVHGHAASSRGGGGGCVGGSGAAASAPSGGRLSRERSVSGEHEALSHEASLPRDTSGSSSKRGGSSRVSQTAASDARYDPDDELGFDLTDIDMLLNEIRSVRQPKAMRREQAKRAHFKRMLGPKVSCRHLFVKPSPTASPGHARWLRGVKLDMRRSIDMPDADPRRRASDPGSPAASASHPDISFGREASINEGPLRRCWQAARARCVQQLTKLETWANRMPVLHPHGPLRLLWNVVIVTLVIYCLVSVPLQVCFFRDFQILHPQSIAPWSVVDTIVDVFFMIDIAVNVRTGYMKRGIFVRDARLICHHYAKGGALIDVLSSLPIGLILTASLPATWCDPISSGNLSVVESSASTGIFIAPVVTSVFSSLNVNASELDCESDSSDAALRCYVACDEDGGSLLGRANRMIRLLRFFKVVRAIRLGSYLQSMFDVANFNPGLFRLIICLFSMLLACHWIGCFWYFILEVELRSKPSKATIDAAYPTLEFDRLHYPLEQIQGPFGAVPTEEVWLYGMLWASSVITGFVPFDITPGADGGVYYVCFVSHAAAQTLD